MRFDSALGRFTLFKINPQRKVRPKMEHKAFHGKRRIKRRMVRRARSHMKADRFMRGTYGGWQVMNGTVEFRGCAVGCLSQPTDKSVFKTTSKMKHDVEVYGADILPYIEEAQIYASEFVDETEEPSRSNYSELEEQIGFCKPLIAMLDDCFENRMDLDRAKQFPLEVMRATAVGKDVGEDAVAEFRMEDWSENYDPDELLTWLATK